MKIQEQTKKKFLCGFLISLMLGLFLHINQNLFTGRGFYVTQEFYSVLGVIGGSVLGILFFSKLHFRCSKGVAGLLLLIIFGLSFLSFNFVISGPSTLLLYHNLLYFIPFFGVYLLISSITTLIVLGLLNKIQSSQFKLVFIFI